MMPHSLEDLGWTADFASASAKYSRQYTFGRVTCRQRTRWEVSIEIGVVQAGITGAMRRLGRIPVIGDFVVLLYQPDAGFTRIVDILPRKTTISRGIPGEEGADQVIAANIDTVFVVTAAGPDLNSRRLERYLALVHASGAQPVILINKTDLTDDPSSLVTTIAPVTTGIPVIPVSALTKAGIAPLEPYLVPKRTSVLIGSSGVGKSTLINTLLEDQMQEIGDIRDYDGKGRHKTTVRQLFILQNGALIIDNPGLREVGMGTAGGGLGETFPDIVDLAARCRFSDCRHESEPGCAVRQAVHEGTLASKRLENYRRLTDELAFEREKSEVGLIRYERKRWKEISRQARNLGKNR